MIVSLDSGVVIIGAGISGLSLARSLRSGGVLPIVLERSRGVGGRCATRRLDGWPVDHGLPLALRLENRAILGLCGDGFSPAGGVEGAFQSGQSLATRIETLHGAPTRAA